MVESASTTDAPESTRRAPWGCTTALVLKICQTSLKQAGRAPRGTGRGTVAIAPCA
jgi:hypothetical protein